jgi:hypothetical protein
VLTNIIIRGQCNKTIQHLKQVTRSFFNLRSSRGCKFIAARRSGKDT